MPETGPLTRSMDEKFEKLFAMMAEMKAGLEDKMEAGQEEMRSGQEEMRYGQEEIKSSPEFTSSRPTVKHLTFDGQTSWTVFKTQFDVVSSTNGWTDFVRASQLVASLRGSAAEVLQGIPADKLTDFTTIEKALDGLVWLVGFNGTRAIFGYAAPSLWW
ncbi:hypothetical protein AVEN_216465-1 [Araneus ventricosus]|uniref:Uncharacterized protein n=1 Tax=Araneus ventricosus TaxID=182803 RepID=A0A4Y2BLJ0_ARAVE|nr:hypothetical protein AVEN_216465-1 [Araneus ventricosus]